MYFTIPRGGGVMTIGLYSFDRCFKQQSGINCRARPPRRCRAWNPGSGRRAADTPDSRPPQFKIAHSPGILELEVLLGI